MTPTPGDILVSHNARLDAYFAVQITGSKMDGKYPLVSVLTLDWMGKALPTDAEIAAMKPKSFDFFFWNARFDHDWVPAQVPPSFQRVGHRPVLVTTELGSYSGWPDGSTFYSQQQWDARPKALRDKFKHAAAREDETPVVTVNGFTVTHSTNRLTDWLTAAVDDLSIFDDLALLTNVATDRPIPGLFDFLHKHSFINELQLLNHGETRLDLRSLLATRLIIDVTGLTELYLNDAVEFLSLVGSAASDLRIHADADGRWILLHTTDAAAPWSGLSALGGWSVYRLKEMDVASAVRRFPTLRDVSMSGAPGYVRNLAALSALSNLETLRLNDVFGFTPEDIPAPSNFPALQTLHVTSCPADAADAVKKIYKPAAAAGLDLSVRQPRKPEWLAANLDNPFRNWDDIEGITPAQAKKAAALYKTARTDALKVASEADALVALSPIVLTYTEAFNKLDSRSNFIFTEEREQIFEALLQIFNAVDEKRREAGAAPIDQDALIEVMDQVRDF